jgi:ketosteroid isomerase-like protein
MQRDAERNTAIVRELIQAMDAGDLAVLDSLCIPDFVAHFNGIDLSLAQVREAAAGFVGAFPDLQHSIQSIEAAGDRVMLQVLNTATHRGTYIAEVWQQMDVEGLMGKIRAGSSCKK